MSQARRIGAVSKFGLGSKGRRDSLELASNFGWTRFGVRVRVTRNCFEGCWDDNINRCRDKKDLASASVRIGSAPFPNLDLEGNTGGDQKEDVGLQTVTDAYTRRRIYVYIYTYIHAYIYIYRGNPRPARGSDRRRCQIWTVQKKAVYGQMYALF